MFLFLSCVFTFIAGCGGEPSSVSDDWNPIVEDQFLPWVKNGISRELVDRTLNYHGSNIIYQYVDGEVYVYDPKGYCFCNNSVYGNRREFTAHLSVCKALESILQETVKMHSLQDFEFVWSLDDIPMWNIETGAYASTIDNETARKGGMFYPGFGAIRCWSKGGLALPFLGSHSRWNIQDYEKTLPPPPSPTNVGPPLSERKGAVVFRGGPRGCSFERNTALNFVYAIEFNWTRRDCGRFKLLEIANKHPTFINYTSEYLTMAEQEKTFRYMLSVEGFGGWADRLLPLMFGNSVVFNQVHPCDQWFEPLMQPYKHFVPVAHDFRDLVETVVWANSHPNTVATILKNANAFANRYLRRLGMTTFMNVTLSRYSKLLNYKVVKRRGAIKGSDLYNDTLIQKFC